MWKSKRINGIKLEFHTVTQIMQELLGSVLSGFKVEQLLVLVNELGVDGGVEELVIGQNILEEWDVGLDMEKKRRKQCGQRTFLSSWTNKLVLQRDSPESKESGSPVLAQSLICVQVHPHYINPGKYTVISPKILLTLEGLKNSVVTKPTNYIKVTQE